MATVCVQIHLLFKLRFCKSDEGDWVFEIVRLPKIEYLCVSNDMHLNTHTVFNHEVLTSVFGLMCKVK